MGGLTKYCVDCITILGVKSEEEALTFIPLSIN